jgi:glycosyltransferase involved in cell wall biosynthesis
MKVLHVIPSVAARHGGPSVALPAMVQALTDAGVAVDVAATNDDGPGRSTSVPVGEPICRNGARYFFFPKQTEFYKISWPFRSWIREVASNYDLVHIHAVFSFTSIVAAQAARRSGVPYIVRPLGVLNRWGMKNRRPFAKRLSFRFVDGPVLQRASAIHYTSEQEREEAESIGVRNRCFIVPIAVNVVADDGTRARAVFRQRWPQLAGREIVLFLSRIDPKKGLELLLEALPTVIKKRPAVCLLVAGTGSETYLAEMHRKAAQLGIQDRVVWAGFLQGDLKAGAFAEATVFVLPSYSENFGIAAVEALAAGVPSVITTGVGIAPDLKHANAAMVVSPETGAIADAILKVLSQPELAISLSTAGRAFADQHYSFASMGRGLIEMYKAVLGAA